MMGSMGDSSKKQGAHADVERTCEVKAADSPNLPYHKPKAMKSTGGQGYAPRVCGCILHQPQKGKPKYGSIGIDPSPKIGIAHNLIP